jgi:hypothetical protein
MHDYKALGIKDEVYAIQFSSGVVKVGRTQSYGRRIYEHTKAAKARRETVTGEWHMFVDDSRHAELQLMGFATALGGVALPRKAEFFDGVDFDSLVKLATDQYGDFETWTQEQDVLLAQSMNGWFTKV